MQLFYNSEITKETQQISFNKIESRHIIRVLRKKEDDILKITNGRGYLFDAKIIVANDKKCLTEIIAVVKKTKPWHYYLHIAIAPTKNNDRLEWFLEKATEIGIDEITPIICNNSERKNIKADRLEKIIQSAMKQSLKYTLPKLNEITTFNKFIGLDLEGRKIIAHCNEGNKESLKTLIKPSETSILLIGPEGDFSLKEIRKASLNNWTPITLGESRLRTETAAIVATQSIAFINQ